MHRPITQIRFVFVLASTLLAHLPALSEAAPANAPAGRVVLELPPGPGNPRNSEGAFLELKDGGILFVYSRFEGEDADDHGKAVLAARRSSDGGESWTEDVVIATPGEDEAMNVMSVSLLRMQNGDAGMFYLLRESWHDMRMHLRRSSDEGRTWSEPVLCTPAAEYYVVNNDRVIRLASGRLLIPAAWHRKRSDENAPSALDWRAIAMCFLSDDDGHTWRESASTVALPVVHTRTGLQEPGAIELPDGVLWGWARTDLGRQYEFFSHDGGENWSTPQPSRFSSPTSPLSMKRIPGSDRLVAIWNPVPNFQTRVLEKPAGDRTPLVGATGRGTTDKLWSAPFLIDENISEHEGYCYTAMHFTKDALFLAYCAGGKADKGRLNRLRMKKIDLRKFDVPAS